jgi:O-antigen/teichoic acid export membrane protein
MISLIGFLSLPYLTRVLSPKEFGYIGIMQVILFLVVPVFAFRAESLIGINKAQRTEKEYLNFRNNFISFSMIITSILSFTIILFVFIVYKEFFSLFLFALLIGICRYFISIHNQELIQDGNATLYGKLGLLNKSLLLILTIIFLSFFEMSWEGRFLAILIVDFLFSLLRLFLFSDIVKKFYWSLDMKIIKEIVTFGGPLFLALAASWITFQSDKVIVGYFFSIDDVGFYTVSYAVGSFVNNINQSVRNVYVPKLRKDLSKNKGRTLIKKFQLYYGSFILLVAIISSVIFYKFDYYILGNEYIGTWKIIVFVSFAYAFFGIYSAYGAIFEYYKLTVLKTKITIYGAVSNIVLSLSLIPFFGIIAPAIGTLSSFVLITFFSYKYAIIELDKRGVGN